jgi:MoaA/NifB/PqqE/SkfB family radical SAM enzyme
VFEHIRAGASFDRVIQNIRLFNEARDALPDGAPRPMLHFVFALQHANVHELPRFLEMCHELRVDLVSVDHVIVHDGLNEADSLFRHRRLVKDVLEQAAEITERLHLNVDLPDPLAIDESIPDEPHDPLATLRAAAEAPPPPAKIHARDWPMPPNPLPEMVEKIRSAGGGNPDFLQHLEQIGHPFGPFEWGVHHLGDSLIPADEHSRNRCLRPWDETYIDYDGAVAPCENANMGLARWTGVVGEGQPFREIWNGPAYQNLRRSLRTGANFKYCHTCYIARPSNEADWKMSYS